MQKLRKLDLVSRYLSQPVLGAHVFHLRLEGTKAGDMSGTMQRDPNTGWLDLWGDEIGSTKMGLINSDVDAVMMRTYDLHGHDRVHWRLELKGVEHTRLHLIEYPKANLWYLTVESEKEHFQVVPLFDAKLFALEAPARAEMPAREEAEHPRHP